MPPARKKQQGPPPYVDARLEQKLTELGLDVELEPGIPDKEFDEEGSLHNQARIGEPLDQGQVDVFVEKIKSTGYVFYAILAWEKDPKAPLFIVDGNHRYAADKKVGQPHNAYIIKGNTPDIRRKVELLMMTINAEHGKPTDPETRVQHALTLHDRGSTLKEAAILLGVSYSKVNAGYKLQLASQRAAKMKINRAAFDKLPAAHRIRLNQLGTDEVFAEMTKVVIDAGLSSAELMDAMQALTDMTSHQQQMAAIEHVRKAYGAQIKAGREAGAGRGRQTMSPRTQFIMTLGRIENLDDPAVIFSRVQEDDKVELKNRLKHAIEKLTQVYESA